MQPGDTIAAGVAGNAKGSFTVTITDGSEKPFSVSTKMPNAQMSSAEWIAEAPYSGGVLPLANFGNIAFSQSSAIIGWTSGPIGSTAPAFANNLDAIAMETSTGTTKAAPYGLASGGSNLSISWYSAGP